MLGLSDLRSVLLSAAVSCHFSKEQCHYSIFNLFINVNVVVVFDSDTSVIPF